MVVNESQREFYCRGSGAGTWEFYRGRCHDLYRRESLSPSLFAQLIYPSG